MRNYLRRSGAFQRVARGCRSPRRPSSVSREKGMRCVSGATGAPHALTWTHDEIFASPVGALARGQSGRRCRPLRFPGPRTWIRRHDWRRGCHAHLAEVPLGAGSPIFLRHRDRHERKVDDDPHGARSARKRRSRRLQHQRRQHDLGCYYGPHAGQGGDASCPRGRRDARARRRRRRQSGGLCVPESLARSARPRR